MMDERIRPAACAGGRSCGRRRHALISAHARMTTRAHRGVPAGELREIRRRGARAREADGAAPDGRCVIRPLAERACAAAAPHRACSGRRGSRGAFASASAERRCRRLTSARDDVPMTRRSTACARRPAHGGGASDGARFCAAMDRCGGGGCVARYVLRASRAAAAGGEGPRDAAASAAGPQHFGNRPVPPQAMAMAMAFQSLQDSKASPTGRACGRASPT